MMFQKGPEILFSFSFFFFWQAAISNIWNNYTKEIFFSLKFKDSKGKYGRNSRQRRDVDGYSLNTNNFYQLQISTYLLFQLKTMSTIIS